jgi:hypothetical protein
MSITRYTFCILLAATVLLVGCASKPAPDPLAGWKSLSTRDGKKFDQAIANDYQDYVQELRSKHYFIDENNFWFYEDATGQHAVRISIPINGTEWEHVLIYDRNDKRVKVVKYVSGHYRS